MAGAPLGNQNPANGKKWRAAIDRALESRSRVDGKHALDSIAEVFVDHALAGEQWALKEFGDRLDGKAAQAVELTGAEGGPVESKVTVEFVGANKAP